MPNSQSTDTVTPEYIAPMPMKMKIGLSVLKMLGFLAAVVVALPLAILVAVPFTLIFSFIWHKNIIQANGVDQTTTGKITTTLKKAGMFIVAPVTTALSFIPLLGVTILTMSVLPLFSIFTDSLPKLSQSIQKEGIGGFFENMTGVTTMKKCFNIPFVNVLAVDSANKVIPTMGLAPLENDNEEVTVYEQPPAKDKKPVKKDRNNANANQPTQPTNVNNVNDAAGVFPEDPTQQVPRK